MGEEVFGVGEFSFVIPYAEVLLFECGGQLITVHPNKPRIGNSKVVGDLLNFVGPAHIIWESSDDR